MSRIYQVNKPSASPAAAVVAPQTQASSSIAKPATLTSSSSISQTNLSSRNPNIYTNNKSDPSTTTPNNNNNNNNFNSIVPPSPENNEMSQDFTRLLNKLENITSRLESYAQTTENRQVNGVKSVPVNGASPSESFDNLPSIAAFDDLYNATFNSFKSLSAEIGNDVVTIVDLVDKVFKYERSFLVEASRSSQPAQDELMKFYKEFSKCIEDVQSFREKNRQSQLFNHLSAISESIGAFGWISVQPAPSPYVKEMSDAAQFYTNRVLKDYKEKDLKHVNWVKLWLQFLSELQAYVKQFHTTGVVWNSAKKSEKFNLSRISTSGSNVSAAKSAPISSGGPPPPPPPPMPNFNELFQDKKPTTETITAALFAEINKGSDITKGLRQVSDAEKTHKNPNLRGANTVPGGVSSTGSSFTKAAPVNKPPVLELVDKKWKVEYQSNRNDLVIDQTDLKHTIYIFQCKECTITVKGKVNSILIDSCSRVALLFDDVLSTIEFINSKNVQMQVLGRVPTVIIEKTDGCQVYLSKNSLDTEVVSSKSSAMNVLLPNEKGDDFNECPIPEQYKTIIDPKTKKLITSPTELV